MTRIGVCGAAGRMGRAVIELCQDRKSPTLGSAIEAAGSPALGRDAGELCGVGRLGIVVCDQLAAALSDFDVLINFTLADALPGVLAQCRQAGKPMVIGTTGLDAAQTEAVHDAARDIPIVFAPNMSVGVTLCLKLLALAARAVGDESDIEIVDVHHRGKKDAPSGTALRMGEVIAEALGRDLGRCASYGRQGASAAGRDRDTIAFASLRAGDVVGEHTVMFASTGERVEISHKATSRKTFASGALRAAGWLPGRAPGCYDMQDVLGL